MDVWTHILYYANCFKFRLVCRKWDKFIITLPIKTKDGTPKEYLKNLNIIHLGFCYPRIYKECLKLELIGLRLSKDGGEILDKDISFLTNLTSLDLSYNKSITNHGISRLTNLTSLDLSGNEMISDVSTLVNLKHLNLSQNRKITIDDIKNINLTSLCIQDGGMELDKLTELTNLTHIDIMGNHLVNPADILFLTNLTSLYTKGIDMNNYLSTKLTKLRIDASTSNIDHLKLEKLTIIFNPLIKISNIDLTRMKKITIYTYGKIEDDILIQELSKIAPINESYNDSIINSAQFILKK